MNRLTLFQLRIRNVQLGNDMALFVLNSEIVIIPKATPQKPFKFSGVHEVTIKRSLHNYEDTATIKVPRLARILTKNQPSATMQKVGELINDGDSVSISLGYNGTLVNEFMGFVKRRNFGMPFEIECEGYCRQMRQNISLSKFFTTTSVKDLLLMACGIIDVNKNKIEPLTDITLVCNVDVQLLNMTLTKVNGLQVIDEIKKITMGTLAIFFITPTTLWCGFTYSAYVGNTDPFGNGSVSYRLGFNCLKDNGLRERVVDEPVQVILSGTFATGQRITTQSEASYAIKKDKTIINNVGSVATAKAIANEKQYQANYHGYMGHITAFLQPFAQPGYKAIISDDEYSERNGIYMVESTSVSFGVSGARRSVELGPMIGFNPKKQTN